MELSVWIILASLCPSFGQDGGGPYDVVARQLVDEECPEVADPGIKASWSWVQSRILEGQAIYFSGEPVAGLQAVLEALAALLGNLQLCFQCPGALSKHLRLAGEWSVALGHSHRARVLIQVGNQFKLQAMARWWNSLGQPGLGGTPSAPPPGRGRWEVRMQVEYTIALQQLHPKLQAPVRAIRQHPAHVAKPQIQVHSICTYKPDPTSNTGSDSPLPDLSVPNHRAYAQRHGYKYVLTTELPLPDREAHYSKMLVVYQALQAPDGPEWVLFIDCDAFFTNAAVAIEDLLETYAGGATAASGPFFLVAEDPGGINTGVFIFRRGAWSLAFLDRVSQSHFDISWDQGMFFWEMVRENIFRVGSADFQMPPEVLLMPQAHLNAFVPPASKDWMAYEWQPGDYVRHFAGCPWQEAPCLNMMRETASYAQQNIAALSSGSTGYWTR